jgi:flagellar biosynthesis/type III secretory pathway chaperone
MAASAAGRKGCGKVGWREVPSSEIRREVEELRVKRGRLRALSEEASKLVAQLERGERVLRVYERAYEVAEPRYRRAIEGARRRYERASKLLRWVEAASRALIFLKPLVERQRRAAEEAHRAWIGLEESLEGMRAELSRRRGAVAKLRAELEEKRRRIAELEAMVKEEVEELKRKRPIEVLTVIDSRTGYDLSLLAYPVEGRRLWLIHPDTGRFIQPVEYVEVEWTASISTEGHEPLGEAFNNPVEVTAQTFIKPDQFHKIEGVTSSLREGAIELILLTLLGNIPRRAIRDDFKIQRRDRGAIVEGTIKRMEPKLIEEVWEEVKVLKEGVGYYSATEGGLREREARILERFGERVSLEYPEGLVVVEMPERQAAYLATLTVAEVAAK